MHQTSKPPFAPLPGTAPTPRGLFVDRWGTLLHLPQRGYGKKATDVVFHDGALDALFRMSRLGWKIYLIGNEEEVARGRVSESDWQDIQEATHEGLMGAGVGLTRDYSCIQHPEGVGNLQGDSVYHLPNTGAFYHASHTDGVRLGRSWVVGDGTLELAAGWRAGCHLAAVQTGLGLSGGGLQVEPELWGAGLSQVLAILLGSETVQQA